jgi:large subunit ribosomal protein L17
MRHGKKNNHLGRTKEHRQALLANLAGALITHKRIRTTVAKAKALRVYVEPLITKSKTNTTHSRRTVFSYLTNKFVVQELFDVVSPKIMNRPGGYTRILKIGNRPGDNADMAIIELVDFNELAPGKIGSSVNDKKRRRRSAKKKDTVAPKKEEAVVEAPAEPTADDTTEETPVA